MIKAERDEVWRLESCVEALRAHWDIPPVAPFLTPLPAPPQRKLCQLLSCVTLASYSVFLRLSFLICEVGTTVVPISYCCRGD